MKHGIDCECYCHEPGMSVKHVVACCDGEFPEMCGESHDNIDNGEPCIYLKNHWQADLPHVTKNGLWWY